MVNKFPKCLYDPQSGESIHSGGLSYSLVKNVLKSYSAVWMYNPWTGEKRNQMDIDSDPYGDLIVPDGFTPLASEQV